MTCRVHTLSVAVALSLWVSQAGATPSTQIWIPSTDVQPYGVLHAGFDSYLRTSDRAYLGLGDRDPNVYDAGLTIGLLPFGVLKLEAGVDCIVNGTSYDDHPLYFNAKLGVPEGTLCAHSPALAVGGYNFGTDRRSGSATRTDQDVLYLLAAVTVPGIAGLPSTGRLSAGFYAGNDDLLVGPDGSDESAGLLLSWDRTMSEISDKLWMAVDYQGGDNALGALSFGISWAFTPNVSLILGFDRYNEADAAGANTATVQFDINF